ncbi:MAG: FAD-binding protein, partial [Pseudoflavonifractor sp.]
DELAAEGKYVFKADSIEALATAAGIDPSGLAATVKQYNADLSAGKDSAFGRTDAMVALEGPVYAIYTIPYVLITSGGPAINENAQMLREDGSAIEGAYICGELVGMGNVAGHTTIGGIGHGNCATWGIIAAENAVTNAGVK